VVVFSVAIVAAISPLLHWTPQTLTPRGTTARGFLVWSGFLRRRSSSCG